MPCRLPHLTLRFLRSRLRRQDGQALVEFAVVLPVLMLIILGILYFGRYESYSNQMTQIAEVGARDGAVSYAYPSNYSTLATYIQSLATNELASGSSDVQQVSVSVDCGPTGYCNTTPGDDTITVCLQANVQLPFLPIHSGTIEQRATMRIEQAPQPYLTSNAGPNPPTNC